jgi:hypothetical protein
MKHLRHDPVACLAPKAPGTFHTTRSLKNIISVYIVWLQRHCDVEPKRIEFPFVSINAIRCALINYRNWTLLRIYTNWFSYEYKPPVYESPVFFSQFLATSHGNCAQEQPVTTVDQLTPLVRADIYNDKHGAIQNAATDVNAFVNMTS